MAADTQKKILEITGLALLMLGTVLSPRYGQAEVYQFVAPDGTVHFTNVPTDRHYRPLPFTRPPGVSPRQIHKMIHQTGQQYRVDPHLIRAVIKVESDFDPWAVSSAGAQGLMQLMPETASALSVINPFDPAENINGGVRHLRYLLDLFQGNTKLALAAYHAGEKMIQRYGGIPPIPQTRDYVRKVMMNYQKYSGSRQGKDKIYQVVTKDGQLIYTNRPTPRRDSQVSFVEYKP